MLLRALSFAFVVLAASSATGFTAAVDTVWTFTYNGPANNVDVMRIDGVLIAADGIAYFAGTSEGVGTSWDAVIGKIDSDGHILWQRTYDDSAIQNQAYAVAVDSAGYVYALGRAHNGDAQFDVNLLKYDSDGGFIFSREYAFSNFEDFGHSLLSAPDGNLYAAALLSNGLGALGIIKFDSNGDTIWTRQLLAGTSNVNECVGIRLGPDGSIYVGERTRIQTPSDSHDDFFLARVSADGVVHWTRNYDGLGRFDVPIPGAIAVDDAGNEYLAGISGGGGSGDDWLTVKYDSGGNFQWSSRFNGITGDGHDGALDLDVASNGDVYVGGYSNNANNSPEAVLIRYNSSGDSVWVRRLTFNGTPLQRVRAVDIAADGKVYVACEGADLVVMRLDSLGNENCPAVYSGTGNSTDVAVDLHVTAAGVAYLSGYPIGFGSSTDILFATYSWSCCQHVGDHAGTCSAPNVVAVVNTVGVAFRGDLVIVDGECGTERTDVNCSGVTDIIDVITMVDVAFRGADPAFRFCDPCL